MDASSTLISPAHESHFWCAGDIVTPLACHESGSTRVPRAGKGLRRSRTFLRGRKTMSSNTIQKKFVSARRRNQHTGRVRYLNRDDLT